VGVIPMILSGSSLWSPLASVIAFGLLGSMVFTLVAIPVLFVVAHRKRHAALAAPASVVGVVLLLLPVAALRTPRRGASLWMRQSPWPPSRTRLSSWRTLSKRRCRPA